MTKENTKELLKAFDSNKEKAFDMLKNAQELCFDKEDCKSLLTFIKAMEKDAFFGRQYKADLCMSFIKLSAIVQPEISADTTKNIAEKLSVEQLKEFISVYEKNRNILYNALTEYGYTAVRPDGAFYLFVKALEEDAMKFSNVAKEYELLIVPSDSFGFKGYVRIAYCVAYDTIVNSMPQFRKLAEEIGGK